MAANDADKAIAKAREQVGKIDRPALNRLTAAYARHYKRIAPRVSNIAEKANQTGMSAAEVRQSKEIKKLESDIETELTEFGDTTAAEITAGSRNAAGVGIAAAVIVLRAALANTPAAGARITKPSPDALDVMLDWTRPGRPLRRKIDALAPYHAREVSQALVDAIVAGRNPKQTAAIIQNVFGRGLSDAMRMTRTSQLWAYRQSSLLAYQQNGVDGWVWFAQLDERTCLSCISQHGTIHPADEILNDHHNGRCVMKPYIPGIEYQDKPGPEWFDNLSAEKQSEIMPADLLDLYNSGGLDWAKMSRPYQDDVFGEMRRAATVAEILKEA